MNDELLINALRASGRVSGKHLELWKEVAGLMAVLDAIGRDGASAVVKIDGARLDGAVYSVVVSGEHLGEKYFRKDGDDLSTVLREAIDFYRTSVWSDAGPR